jgi:phytanoyl-CoA hydroxylase
MAEPFNLNAKEIKADFDRDGYVVIRGFLNATEVAALQQELDRYVNVVAPTLPSTDVMYEDKQNPQTLKQLARIRQHDAYFADLIEQSKWAGLAEILLADGVVPQELEWFNKPPVIGKPTPPHQDGYYFMLEPNEAVTMWLALDDVDESNGCMRYIPGSQNQGMRPHGRTQVLGFSQGITDFGDADRAAEAPIRAKPGDLLVHHSMTVHRAEGNPSNRHRRSLGFVYYAARAQQDAKTLADYQQKLYKELSTAQKI